MKPAFWRPAPGLLAAVLAALPGATGTAGAAETDYGRHVAAACASCHGKRDPAIPPYRDLARDELVFIMRELREGKRGKGSVMSAIAHGYSDADISALAAFLVADRW